MKKLMKWVYVICIKLMLKMGDHLIYHGSIWNQLEVEKELEERFHDKIFEEYENDPTMRALQLKISETLVIWISYTAEQLGLLPQS